MDIVILTLFTLVVYLSNIDGSTTKSDTYCTFLQSADVGVDQNHVALPETGEDSGGVEYAHSLDSGTVMADNKTIKCVEEDTACFSAWYVDPKNESKITMTIIQGCWLTRDHCTSSTCVAKTSTTPFQKMDPNLRYCCCVGDMCNANFSSIMVLESLESDKDPDLTPESVILNDLTYQNNTIIISITAITSVAVVIVIAFLGYRICRLRRYMPPEADTLIETPVSEPTFDPDELKILSIINKGRYGVVWKGMLNDQEVAVKIFNPGQKQFYNNERDIYMLPHIDHDYIVKFYGADERINMDQNPEYIIVLAHAPYGSLNGYLKNNILDWVTLCKMAYSVASGLAHLHSDIYKGDSFKPAVAHRDFNSRNVLVKSDLTCCITDMGFAIKIMGSKFIRNGHEEIAEQSSLNDVGTLRYMAPEVLDGAVNLRDCESSLKQIDIYALGLVLWELTSRTKELYPGSSVPEYALPYQLEVGPHPSFDEMQQLVSKNKERPGFPSVCVAVNSTQPHLQAIRGLRETIEDCWDQDAEARLTALCVEERIIEIAATWDSRSKGVTPTAVNPTLEQPTVTTDSIVDVNTMLPSTDLSDKPETYPITCHSTSDDDAVVGLYTRLPRQRESLSTITVETVLSPSVDEERPQQPEPSKANVNVNYERALKSRQPHQGRNPTVERNTHKRSEEELAVLGNTLVDAKIAKENAEKAQKRNRAVEQHNTMPTEGHDNINSALVQHDSLAHYHRNTPIPYLQNRVRDSSPPGATPKVANVPGNGSSIHGAMTVNEAKNYIKTCNMAKVKKPKEKSGLFGFLSKNFMSHSNQTLDTGDHVAAHSSDNGHHRSNSDGSSSLTTKSNLNTRPLTTEVRMVNGSAVVQPATQINDSVNVEPFSGKEAKLGMAEVGVAKLQHTSPAANRMPTMVKQRIDNRARSASDLTTEIKDASNEKLKPARPNFLRFKGHNYKSDSQLNRINENAFHRITNKQKMLNGVQIDKNSSENVKHSSLHDIRSSTLECQPKSGSLQAVNLNKTNSSRPQIDGTELNTLAPSKAFC